MKKYFCLIFYLLFFNISFYSQDYKVSSIPESLKKNADAVIRLQSQEVVVKNQEKALLKVKFAVTVLNSAGTKYSVLTLPYNNFIKVKKIKGKVYDEYGNRLKKVKRLDILDYSDFTGYSLYSDNRFKYIDSPPYDPPYTVEYEFKLKFKGLLNLPTWYPVKNERVAVQSAKISVLSKNVPFSVKEVNFDQEDKIFDNVQSYKKELTNFEAKVYEKYSNKNEYFPYILISPLNFEIDGYKGSNKDWKTFGLWCKKLNNGRDVLDDKTKEEIKNLTKGISDPLIKAKTVYEYMQNKTRYVSIQLGIGGWQAFYAYETDRNGYGDCKALSIYTKALLKEVGIKSYYTLVKAGPDAADIHTDFVSSQFNHAILCLPNLKDTIWLECTSQTTPFGFIGSFTDDRDVLLITKEGGKIAHTKSYDNNIKKSVINAKIDKKGNLNASIFNYYSGIFYNSVDYLSKQDKRDCKKNILSQMSLKSGDIDSVIFKKNKQILPDINQKIYLKSKKFASTSKNRLFLPLNFTYKKKKIYEPNKREKKIYLRRTKIFIDSIFYSYPKNYVIEYLPEKIEVNFNFGYFKIDYENKGNKIFVYKKTKFKKGQYPLSDYTNLKKFFKIINKANSENAVLKKK